MFTTNLIAQKLMQREWKKSITANAAKAKIFIGAIEFKISFWEKWRGVQVKWQPSKYRLGKGRLVMV